MTKWIVGAIGLASLAAIAGFTRQATPSLINLAKDETWEVDFRRSGCFSSSRYMFSFRRGQALEAEVFDIKFNAKSKDEVKSSLGKIRLNASEAAGIDNLLRFYRSKPEGYCTTIDTVELVRYRDGQEISREHFEDPTCSYDRKDFVRLEKLAERLTKP